MADPVKPSAGEMAADPAHYGRSGEKKMFLLRKPKFLLR